MRKTTALILAVSFATFACGKKKDDDEEEATPADGAPITPSPSTLTLDLSSSGGQSLTESAGLNHNGAMLFVAVINLNVAAQLSIPVALLRKAEDTTPVYAAENTWLWSFTVPVNGNTWTGNLTGVKTGEGTASWSMEVTNSTKDGNGCCDKFVFFTGATATTTAGTWLIMDPRDPTNPEARLFQVTYDYKSETDKKLDFVMRGEKPASERFGEDSYVNYVVTSTDASLVYKDSAEDGERLVTWSLDTKAGSHTDDKGVKVCWGPEAQDFPNVTCP